MIIWKLEWQWLGAPGTGESEAGPVNSEYFGTYGEMNTRRGEIIIGFWPHLRLFMARLTTRDDLTQKQLLIACLNRTNYFATNELKELIDNHADTEARQTARKLPHVLKDIQ